MKEYDINNQKYRLIKEIKEGFNLEEVTEKLTEFFDIYDYILGDWAYGKLRLKGFTKKENNKNSPINDYSNVDDYLKNYCAFGCRYFILEKIRD